MEPMVSSSTPAPPLPPLPPVPSPPHQSPLPPQQLTRSPLLQSAPLNVVTLPSPPQHHPKPNHPTLSLPHRPPLGLLPAHPAETPPPYGVVLVIPRLSTLRAHRLADHAKAPGPKRQLSMRP